MCLPVLHNKISATKTYVIPKLAEVQVQQVMSNQQTANGMGSLILRFSFLFFFLSIRFAGLSRVHL